MRLGTQQALVKRKQRLVDFKDVVVLLAQEVIRKGGDISFEHEVTGVSFDENGHSITNVKDENGNAYVVVCEGSDTGGRVFLLDGKTGEKLYTFNAEKNIEASPAVYGNMLVFGTRGMKIWGVKIS